MCMHTQVSLNSIFQKLRPTGDQCHDALGGEICLPVNTAAVNYNHGLIASNSFGGGRDLKQNQRQFNEFVVN